jgi:surface protein
LEEAFNNCLVLNEIDVSTWDVSSVTWLRKAFAYCKALSVIDVSNWHTGKLINAECMFMYCESVKRLEPLYFNVSTCKYLSQCYDHCRNLEYCDVGNWDARAIRSVYNMWYGCNSLTELDLSGFDTSHIPTDAATHNVFSGCFVLHTIYASESFKLLSTQDCANLFWSCFELVGGNGTVYDASHQNDYSYACIDTDAHPGYFTYKDAPAPQTKVVTGDLTGEEKVGAEDAQMALQAYVNTLAGKPSGLTDAQKAAADVNKDGKVDAVDAQIILQYYVNGLAGKVIPWETLVRNSQTQE